MARLLMRLRLPVVTVGALGGHRSRHRESRDAQDGRDVLESLQVHENASAGSRFGISASGRRWTESAAEICEHGGNASVSPSSGVGTRGQGYYRRGQGLNGKQPQEATQMRQRMLLLTLALMLVGLAIPSASQAATQTLTMKAKITRFHASGNTLTATGVLTGTLGSGGNVTKDTAPVRFRVSATRSGRRCDILTLNLQQLYLELLGAEVQTSAINLELYATRGAVLGNLFCALSRAEIRLPRVAAAMNRKLPKHGLQVMAAEAPVRANAAQTPAPTSCQVLKLILGPLHLNLLGLNVDLYGKTKNDPVVVTINALPDKGLLGQILCSLAGGSSITSLPALQSLIQRLGVTISDVDLQNLLNNLGIDNLTSGLTDAQLQQILQALGQL